MNVLSGAFGQQKKHVGTMESAVSGVQETLGSGERKNRSDERRLRSERGLGTERESHQN